jgi:hypothetical protein
MTVMSLRRSGPALAAAAALVAASCVPALASGGNTVAGARAPGMLQAGQVAGRSAVPWRLVGPGWTLAVAQTAPANVAQHVRVLLIDPRGGTYDVFTWPTPVSHGWVRLLDWSSAGWRALFELPAKGGAFRLDQLMLRTGTLTGAVLAPSVFPMTYTRPLGKQVLAIGGNFSNSIVRISLSGRVIKSLAPGRAFGQAVVSPGGQLVAAGMKRGVAFISNEGGVARQVGIRGANPTYGCSVVRWWDATHVLTLCAKRLWLVPAGHGAPVALTSQPQTQLMDGWRAGKSLFVQQFLSGSTHPGCEVGLKRQQADGSLVLVNVPGLGCSSGGVLASVGGRLLILGQPGDAGGSLRWFNPATGKIKILYKPEPGAEGIVFVVAFGEASADSLWGS